MTASLSSRTQQVLAADISEMDKKLITATEGNKLFGLVCKTRLAWHDLKMQAQCVDAATRPIT